jgi:hypothetical protein
MDAMVSDHKEDIKKFERGLGKSEECRLENNSPVKPSRP